MKKLISHAELILHVCRSDSQFDSDEPRIKDSSPSRFT
jgi:hypothetical protein